MKEPPRLTFVALNVSNLDASVGFYRMILGDALHESSHDAELNDVWYGGRHAACSWTDGAFMHFALYPAREPQRPVSQSAQVGFHLDGFDEVHARLVAGGAPVLQEPRVEPWGKTARYADPDGNIVSISSRGD